MEFDFLLPENNNKKISQKQNVYRNVNEIEDKPKMDHFLCIHPDPADALEFRPFPEFRVNDLDLLTENILNEAHLLYKPQQCESNPTTPRSKEKADECHAENEILLQNMARTWEIVENLPFTSGLASPLVYSANIDVESRLKAIDYKATSIDKNRDYSTQIQSFENLFNEERNPYVSGGVNDINNTFNQTSVGFIDNRQLFGESTKRKTAFE